MPTPQHNPRDQPGARSVARMAPFALVVRAACSDSVTARLTSAPGGGLYAVDGPAGEVTGHLGGSRSGWPAVSRDGTEVLITTGEMSSPWKRVMSALSRETRPPCRTFTLALVALLALAPLKAGAQVAEDTEVSPSTWWLTLGVGPTSREVATLLSLSTAYRPGRAGSLRLIEASRFDPMGPGTGMELREVSLIWHLGDSLDAVWYSIGAGVGVAWGTDRTLQGFTVLESKVGPSPGLAIESQVQFRPHGRIGGGVVAFGHLGDGTSFGLLAVSNGLKVGELAMHEVDHGDEVAGGSVSAGASLGGLNEGG